MTVPRTSVLRDEQALRAATDGANNIAEILGRLNLRAAGGNYKSIQAAAIEFGIDLPKHKPTVPTYRIPDEEIFIANSSYHHRGGIKKRLFEMGVPRACTSCGVGEIWNGHPLTLTLEHINGIWNDHRRENLTILCPNCHSQTSTYAGRSSKKVCTDCGDEVSSSGARCRGCAALARDRPKAADWPPLDELIATVSELGFAAVGRQLGVSDTSVKKHLRSRKVDPKGLRRPNSSKAIVE